MAVTIDGTNLLITLESGITEVEVKDIYEDWKDWVRAGNAQYPQAFRPVGGDPLSSIIDAGSYFFLNNVDGWRIKPPEEDITVYLTGNLAVEDTLLPAIEPTIGTYTAAVLGLQPVTQGVTPVMKEQLAYASFNGGVTYDITSPYSGFEYQGNPVGTAEYPVNNVYDAADIALQRGLARGYIIGDLTFPTDLPLSNFTFIGSGKDRTTISIPDAATVSDCTYTLAEVTGYLDGNNTLINCIIKNLSYIKGFIEQCVLSEGTIVLGGSEVAHFLDCWSGVPGTTTPIIDMGGSGQPLALRNYNGGIKLINKSGPEEVSIDLNSGQVILDNTVTAGTIVIRGIGKLMDTLGNHIHSGTWNGVTIVNEAMNLPETVEQVWAYTGP